MQHTILYLKYMNLWLICEYFEEIVNIKTFPIVFNWNKNF